MNNKEFEEAVKEGINAIPKKFLEKLDNVDICIEEEPEPDQLKKVKRGENSLILGLYEGIPQINRGSYGQVLPDKITIFKRSIERVAQSKDEIKKTVRDTVWHEIAHHFGMNEAEVRRAERKRRG
jgi:predicted Zn-dependent protease with MMP-like domain